MLYFFRAKIAIIITRISHCYFVDNKKCITKTETKQKIIIEQETKKLEEMQECIDGVVGEIYVGEIHEFPLHLHDGKERRCFKRYQAHRPFASGKLFRGGKEFCENAGDQ